MDFMENEKMRHINMFTTELPLQEMEKTNGGFLGELSLVLGIVYVVGEIAYQAGKSLRR
jgi:hypothetical protein